MKRSLIFAFSLILCISLISFGSMPEANAEAACGSVSASASKTTITIVISKTIVCQYYEVYRCVTGSGNWVKVVNVTCPGSNKTVSCVDSGAKSGVSYTYRVRACYGGSKGYSSYTSSGSCKIEVAVKKPGNINYINCQKSKAGVAYVSWGKVSGCDGYEVCYRTSTSGSFSLAATCSSSSSNCTVKGLTSGKAYYFAVRCFIISGGKKIYSDYTPAVKCIV